MGDTIISHSQCVSHITTRVTPSNVKCLCICKNVVKCKNMSTLNVKSNAIFEKNNSKCEQIWLSKCLKHFYSKCLKIDVICANFQNVLYI